MPQCNISILTHENEYYSEAIVFFKTEGVTMQQKSEIFNSVSFFMVRNYPKNLYSLWQRERHIINWTKLKHTIFGFFFQETRNRNSITKLILNMKKWEIYFLLEIMIICLKKIRKVFSYKDITTIVDSWNSYVR